VLSFTNLCLVQGIYYLLTGLWPLLNLSSFEAVAGPKTDGWLVRAVGLLVAVDAAVLLLAAWRRRETAEIAMLAIGSAVALTAIDLWQVLRGVISQIYLCDAVAEAVLLAGWVRLLAPEKHAGSRAGAALPRDLHDLG
jgi:hypothetical protein